MLQKKEKLYYTIGEVKEITEIEPHVLRYWENEFPTLKPRKSNSGKRSYTRKDIETIHHIKRLLYGEKFTIKGAKNKIKGIETENKAKKKNPIKTAPTTRPKSTQLIFGEIEQNIHKNLDNKDFLKELKTKLLEASKTLKRYHQTD